MAIKQETYCIRPDYRPTAMQATYDTGGAPSYWNADRLRAAADFQYDVYRIAARLARARGRDRVLDVGSGPPVKLRALMETGPQLWLVDQPTTAPLAAEFLPDARFVPANLEEGVPELGVACDLIICADVIEHLVDPDPCVTSMRDRLSADGLLIISTPERHTLRGRDCLHSPHPMHVREWSFVELATYLRSRELRIVDHRLLPQRRVSGLRRTFGRLAAACGRPPEWYSCQMVICRRG
jgi:SAM-dependent methyltransferase